MLTLNEHLLNQVLLIAYQAGKHLQQFYQKQVHVDLKEDNTPVTEADLFVSQFLTAKLTALYELRWGQPLHKKKCGRFCRRIFLVNLLWLVQVA